jgi:hypothetical protein
MGHRVLSSLANLNSTFASSLFSQINPSLNFPFLAIKKPNVASLSQADTFLSFSPVLKLVPPRRRSPRDYAGASSRHRQELDTDASSRFVSTAAEYWPNGLQGAAGTLARKGGLREE